MAKKKSSLDKAIEALEAKRAAIDVAIAELKQQQPAARATTNERKGSQ